MSAKRLYESFKGAVARKIIRAGVRFGGQWLTDRGQVNILIPDELAIIGHVSAIEYDCTRDGKRVKARHVFAPGSRPYFAVGNGRGEMFLLGTGYRFTDRGIVDYDGQGRAIDYDEKTGRTKMLD